MYWLKFLKMFCFCHPSPFFFKLFKPKQKKRFFIIVGIGTSPPSWKWSSCSRKLVVGSFQNKSQNTLHLSHHRLIKDDLFFPFYWLGSLGGVSYRVTISVCLSVCLSVPSQNNHLQVSWRLLVEERVPYIGLWSHHGGVSFFF